jgi:hypothetical protein
MRPATYAICALLIMDGACGSSPDIAAGPSASGLTSSEFEVRATSDGVEFTNHSPSAIYYRARDPLSLALSDRIPCLAPDPCPHVPARSRVTVPFEEAIVGYRSDTQRATVHWWHFVPRADGSFTADEVRTIEVMVKAP